MPTKKLLSLSILLLILITPASAYGIREENIWIFQGSYELGIGERAYLEGFTIKIHDINVDNKPSATLLVYMNSVFKEAVKVDNGLNNEHIYDNELRINVLSISQEKVSLEIYKQKSELVWITDIPKTSFKIGDILTGDEYKINLKDVNEDGALISVEYDGSKLEETYNSGDYQKFSDEFMINVVYLKKDTKEVFIETLKPGSPNIQLDSANVKDSYEPDEYVEYELLVTNNGTIPLHGMIVSTECNDGEVDGGSQQYSILESGKQKKFIIKVKPQIEPMGKNITIISKVQGYDYRGNEYNREIATDVNVKPYISIEKEIIARNKISEKPEFGTEQYFQIIITLQNKANFQTAVSVTDKLPASFIPDDIDNTEWTILLDSGTTEAIEYFVSPTEPGDFKFMPATVAWKDGGETYTLESETIDQTFHVSGSKVTVEKELSSSYMLAGEEIDIIIVIINEGDSTFKASFRESIPDELTFIEGDSEWDGTLEAGEKLEFTYSVRAERAGEYYLPQTELSITDEEGKKESIVSAEPFLYIDDALVEYDDYIEESSYNELYDNSFENNDETTITTEAGITRVEAAGFLTSSFISLFLLIAAVPAFAYLYIIRVYK
ncbi:hypothetical protein [uncultured Methanolobus sp.]|uniref:hypothetical protein n=1 Tax=uncultured Methanolobus sp. TaxID=218300 RepID=UPI0029C93D97|nr:hypothetical protein [uncultured Methanolobus sp.]